MNLSNILELLAIEDCENDNYVILNSVDRIIKAIRTWNISDSDYNILLEFINKSFFQRNKILQGILILETYITCKNDYSNEKIKDCIYDFYRSVSQGLVVSSDDFEILTQFSKKYNLYNFEYSSYYDNAKILLQQRKIEYNLIVKFLPHMRICISENIKTNSTGFSLFEYIVKYNSYEVEYYIKNNEYTLIKCCFQEILELKNEWNNNYKSNLLFNLLAFLVNKCKINNKIFEYYEKNDQFKSIVVASPEKYTTFLAKILAYLLLYGTMNEFKESVEICLKLPINTDTNNKFNYAFSRLNYNSFLLRENPQSSTFITIYNKVCYFERTLTFMKIETTEYISFINEIKKTKYDIDLIKKYLDYYDEMILGDLWIKPITIPKKIVYSFKFPNGVRGDINKYFADKYGTISQISELKYKAIIQDIPLEHLSILLEAQSGNDIPEQNLKVVGRYFKPHITESFEFKNRLIYRLPEWTEVINKRDMYWNGMQNISKRQK